MNMAKPKTILVRFLRDTLAKEGEKFVKDQVKELTENSALRWIRRGAAEETTAPKAAPTKQKTKETK